MRDYINIGPVPCDEDCAQVWAGRIPRVNGERVQPVYRVLRKTFGDEPEGARLAIKWFDRDFGFYCEVVCWYETEDEKARGYAFRCENEMPLTWEGDRREQLKFPLRRVLATPRALQACEAAGVNSLNLLQGRCWRLLYNSSFFTPRRQANSLAFFLFANERD